MRKKPPSCDTPPNVTWEVMKPVVYRENSMLGDVVAADWLQEHGWYCMPSILRGEKLDGRLKHVREWQDFERQHYREAEELAEARVRFLAECLGKKIETVLRFPDWNTGNIADSFDEHGDYVHLCVAVGEAIPYARKVELVQTISYRSQQVRYGTYFQFYYLYCHRCLKEAFSDYESDADLIIPLANLKSQKGH